ncbi:hypothetical protein CEUSTIGMA_g11019.t1 [Chlamydomonas eustigma]|uniref:MMS19 nucleotide excision repair protein n=1 Tax=Chlamydomonas eustigma TaxID=1157962 RepID=A0A250XKJ5_9CHLO|nr:hypothetical protein CEUSTIGMA_g11019.t1 [Chlamydomonas eustigma]|eukprot:GAX83594.1 hypothetical protein CEUSTIGMA_g11019.t1 [Chlamydomonas eustigma]
MDSIHPCIHLYLADDASDTARSESAQTLVQKLRSGDLTVPAIVLSLQQWLTNPDPYKRNAGTKLLVEVVEGAPELLKTEHVHVIAEFLTARLADWQCVEAAAKGCLALVNRGSSQHFTENSSVSPGLDQSCALEMMAKFVVSVQVPPLARPERQACLTLWLKLLERYGSAAASSPAGAEPSKRSIDLVDATIAAIDEEKDPRCLKLSFNIIKATCAAYHLPGVNPEPLQRHAQELAEVMSCYFPVRFTPPKNDPHGITRQQLEDALEEALSASPFLCQWVMPLILEKLTSTHRPSKEDAMSALVRCSASFGREALLPYFDKMWQALRFDIMSPSEPGVMPGEDLDQRKSLSAAAAACLRRCLMVLGPATIDKLVASDMEVVGELRLCLELPVLSSTTEEEKKSLDPEHLLHTTKDIPMERRIMCASAAVAAVSAASPSSCSTVLHSILPLLLNVLPPADSGGELSNVGRNVPPVVFPYSAGSYVETADPDDFVRADRQPLVLPHLNQAHRFTLFLLNQVLQAINFQHAAHSNSMIGEIPSSNGPHDWSNAVPPSGSSGSDLEAALPQIATALLAFGSLLNLEWRKYHHASDADASGNSSGNDDTEACTLVRNGEEAGSIAAAAVPSDVLAELTVMTCQVWSSIMAAATSWAAGGTKVLLSAVLLHSACSWLVKIAIKCPSSSTTGRFQPASWCLMEPSRMSHAAGLQTTLTENDLMNRDGGAAAVTNATSAAALTEVAAADVSAGPVMVPSDVVVMHLEWGESRSLQAVAVQAAAAAMHAAQSAPGCLRLVEDVVVGDLMAALDTRLSRSLSGSMAAAERRQILSVAASLSKASGARRPMGWMIVSRLREEVLRVLQHMMKEVVAAAGSTNLGSMSRNLKEMEDLYWVIDVLVCLAKHILPFRCISSVHHSSCLGRDGEAAASHYHSEAQEAASFARAILETLSITDKNPDNDMKGDATEETRYHDGPPSTSVVVGGGWEESQDVFCTAFRAAGACVRCLVAMCSDEQQQEIASKAATIIVNAASRAQKLSTEMDHETPQTSAVTSSCSDQQHSQVVKRALQISDVAAVHAACMAITTCRALAATACITEPTKPCADFDSTFMDALATSTSCSSDHGQVKLVLPAASTSCSSDDGQAKLVLPAALLYLAHESQQYVDRDTSSAACTALAALVQHVPIVKAGQSSADTKSIPSSALLVNKILEGESGLLLQSQRRERSMHCMAVIAQVLAMRGHPMAMQAVHAALSILTERGSWLKMKCHQQEALAKGTAVLGDAAAAEVLGVLTESVKLFGVIMSNASSQETRVVSSADHLPDASTSTFSGTAAAKATPTSTGMMVPAVPSTRTTASSTLWQQRTFSKCLSAIKACLESAGHVPQQQQQCGSGGGEVPAVQLALMHLLGCTPVAIYLPSSSSFLPHLVRALKYFIIRTSAVAGGLAPSAVAVSSFSTASSNTSNFSHQVSSHEAVPAAGAPEREQHASSPMEVDDPTIHNSSATVVNPITVVTLDSYQSYVCMKEDALLMGLKAGLHKLSACHDSGDTLLHAASSQEEGTQSLEPGLG